MTDKGLIFEVMKSRPVSYRADFARIAGSVTAGVMLSQAIFWTGKSTVHGPDEFEKKGSEWEDETALSEKQQQTARHILEKAGLMTARRGGMHGTMIYKVNEDAIYEALTVLYADRQKGDSAGQIGKREKPDRQKGETRSAKKTFSLNIDDNIDDAESSSGEDWFIQSKQVKTESKKPKKSNLLIIEEIQPLMDILTQNKVPLSTINNEVRGLMRSAVEQHGIDLCKAALRGRIIQADAKGTDLYLRSFFSPDKSDWLGGCAKIGAMAEQIGPKKSDPNHGYKSQIRPELADEYENAGRVAI
jgi:hypothetical protein